MPEQKKFEIKNCFEFICPLKWDNLEKTDNNNIRFCGSCEKQIYKAKNMYEFFEMSEQNKCIAYKEDDNTPGIMGETIPPALNMDIELD